MRRRGAAGGAAFAGALLFLATAIPAAAPLRTSAAAVGAGIKQGRCSYQRVHGGKMAASCYMQDLRKVPDSLHTDIEVLDLSYNRIRELNTDSFARYTWLQKLYLDDNMITHVEEGAFDPLQRLQELSLSLTGLFRVPPGVLRLPLLIALDISSNRLDAEALDSDLASAPADVALERLSLASCGLRRLPSSLAGLPRLSALNVSGNALDELEVALLAPLCSLRELTLPADVVVDRCGCALLKRWAERDGLRARPQSLLQCEAGSTQECTAALEAADAAHADCRKELAAQEGRSRSRLLWRAVGGAAIVVLAIVVASILYCWCRRRRRKTRPQRVPYSSESKSDDEDEESREMHSPSTSWKKTKDKF